MSPPLEVKDVDATFALKLSYDMKAVTKEWSIAEKNLSPAVGIEPGPPGWKSNALTTEPKSRLPDAIVRHWIYT